MQSADRCCVCYGLAGQAGAGAEAAAALRCASQNAVQLTVQHNDKVAFLRHDCSSFCLTHPVTLLWQVFLIDLLF
jgi:hypothetical protein